MVIVDGKSNAEVIALLRDTRTSRLKDATLAVAVVAGQESIRELFSLGVNFVLYKPVAYDRALSSLRAACEVMRKEKRKNARATVHAHATADYANIEQEKATLVDLAQDGMCVQVRQETSSRQQGIFSVHAARTTVEYSFVRAGGLAGLERPRWISVYGCAQGLAPPADRLSLGQRAE